MRRSGGAAVLPLLIAAFVGAVPQAAGGERYPETTLLAESASGLVFEYEMPRASTRDLGDGLVAIDLPAHGGLAMPGFPSVPTRTYCIALPPGAEVSVELRGVELEESDAYAVAPRPSPPRLGEDVMIPDWSPVLEPGLQPEGLYDLSRPARLRDQRVVSLTLHPVRYDRATGRTVFLKRAEVHVSFRGTGAKREAAPPATDPLFASVYESALLNPRSGADWLRAPGPRVKRSRADDSFASSSDWVKLGIADRGMHVLTYDDLTEAGVVDPRSAIGDARSIRMYWGGGQVLPESLAIDRPAWMEQVSIHVAGEEDGSFDPGDRVEFFALGDDGWLGEFLPDTADYYEPFEHRYASEGVYWLTWGGDFAEPVRSRMGTVNAGAGAIGQGAEAIRTFPDRAHYEVDILQDLTRKNSDSWFWERFESSSSGSNKFFRNLITDDADTSQSSQLIVQLYPYVEGEVSTCGYERGFFWVNNVPADSIEWNSCRPTPTGPIGSVRHSAAGSFVRNGSNIVRIWGKPGQGAFEELSVSYRSKYYLDWIELAYQRFARLREGEPLHVRLDEGGEFRLAVSGVSGRSIRAFEVSDPRTPSELSGLSESGDSLVLHISRETPSTYEVVSAEEWKSPKSVEKVNVPDLRNPTSSVRYLMVVWDDFLEEAAPLAQHRAKEYSVRVYSMSDVFDNFSWGQKDATALRDFFAWAYHDWPVAAEEDRLAFVLMVGDATIDWKSRLDSAIEDLIPTWYFIDPNGSDTYTYPTDDYFTYLDPADGDADWAPDIAIGRLPADDESEVTVMVDKIIDYETDPELGDWRSRVLLLGDDEYKGLAGDCGFFTRHVEDAEQLAKQIPHCYNRDKLYLTEYPLNFAGEKPLAQSAYVEWIHRGFLASSYTGHGGFAKMADENIFNEAVANCDRLRNGKRLGLFTAWSCSIGSFDLLELNSLAEILFKLDGCGSIGSFSSGAPAFPNASTRLQRAFFGGILPGCSSTMPIGLSAMAAKGVFGDRHLSDKRNDEKYNLMGDPALELAVPEMEVRIDNQENLEFQRSDSTVVSGAVLLDDSTVATGFDGECVLNVWGMADTSGYRYIDSICGAPRERFGAYHLLGPTFYRGTVDVTAGRFEQSFFVPLDTRLGNLSRVSAYMKSAAGGIDAAGGYDSATVVAEPPGSAPMDSSPPALEIGVDGTPIRNGTSFTRESIFRVTLDDPSGINLQQNDDFYTINLVFDGGRPIDMTSYFFYDRNSARRGSFSFTLNDLPQAGIQEGGHELAFRAADNLNQRVERIVPVVLVSGSSELAFRQEVLNYPNPFDPDVEETAFFVDLTKGGSVTIEVFTATGKRIWIRRDCLVSGPSILYDCAWDGRDMDGDVVGNGTYLVRATVVSDDGTETVESIGKVVVLRGVD